MSIATQVHIANLWCSRCGVETVHVVFYVGPQIKEIRCSVCNDRLVRPITSLRQHFARELPQRARAFALHELHDLQHHPVSFVKQLPHTLVRKSLEVSAEINALMDEPPC